MTFLNEPAPSEGQQKLYDADAEQDGFVWDNSKLWAHLPALDDGLSALIVAAADAAGLSRRQGGARDRAGLDDRRFLLQRRVGSVADGVGGC